jgi:creatinine amidohydrolase
MLLQEMTWPEINNLSRDIPVVVPVAALEQHGQHMPVFTDSLLVGEVVRRVGATMSDRLLIAPLMWLGNSHHHMDFQGTLSASPRVYLDLLNDLAENLIAHGFKRIVFVNGHGGNITPGKQAIFELRQRHRDRSDLLLLFASYWDNASPNAGRPDLVQSQMGHACEWETSMMLRLAPNLVKDFSRAEPVGFEFGFEPAYRGWTTKDRTVTGHIGHPQAATADKGEYLFATYAAGVGKLLEDVIAWDGKSWEMP